MTLPTGWIAPSIGDVCELANGMAFKPTDWAKAGLPIIRIQNLNRADAEYNYCDRQVDPRFLVEPGELLFAWSGTPGTSFGAHIWEGGQAVLNQHIFRVRFRTELLDRMFFKLAINAKLEELIGKAHGGVGLRHVTKGKFEETEIGLPPLAEQRRIVAKLDTLTARLTRARAELDRVAAMADRIRDAALDAVFDATSETSQLGDLALDVRYGTAQKCTYGDDGVAVLRIPNIQRSGIKLDDLKRASFSPKEVDSLALRLGDVLIIRSNGSLDLVGRAAVVDVDAVGLLYAGYLIRLRIDQAKLDPEFLRYALSSRKMRTVIENLARSTSGVNNINAQQLRALIVPRPPLHQQVRLIAEIKLALARADRLEAEAARARALLDRLEAAILARAFRGELVPQDAADEPASALLERIRSERAAAPKAARGRRARAA